MNVFRHPRLEVYLLVICSMAEYDVARTLPERKTHIRHAQRFLDLKLSICHPESFQSTSGYICCSGRLLPGDHQKLKCLYDKPFKRTKTKIKCGQKSQLLSKYSKKYGCCKDRRYKLSRLLCHSGHIYKPLKIPCLPGFQPSVVMGQFKSPKPSYSCEPCPAGSFSAHFGLEKCSNCSRCEHVITECQPDRDSQCESFSEYDVRTLCHGNKCRAWKGKRRPGIRMGLKNPRKRPMKIDVDSVLPSFKDTTSIVWTNFTSPLAVNTTGSPKPVRCCDFNTTRLQPYEENTTLSSGTNLDEKESRPYTRSLHFVVMSVILSSLGFFAIISILLLIVKLFRKILTRRSKLLHEAASSAASNEAYWTVLQEDSLSPDGTASNTNCLDALDFSTAGEQQHNTALPGRAYLGHRRCRSDSFITTGSSIRLLYANLTESQAWQKSWPDVMDLAYPKCPNKPITNSLSDWSKTFYSLPGWLNVINGNCHLPSVDNVFSESLEFWKLLPAIIKHFDKFDSYSDMKAVDYLVRDQFTQTSLKKTNRRNILGGEWDICESFDHNGGSLEKAGSAVNLMVPSGAVDVGSAVKIHGKIFTSLQRFFPIFKLRQGEHFVSPVVEFVETQRFQFHRHLVIKIPVSQCDLDDSTFRVLCIPGDDDMTVTSVPRHATRRDVKPDVYYDVIEEGFVHVYTKHFTAFACSSCNRDKIYLEGVVMSRTRAMDDRLIEVTIRLFICDKLHLIKDFLTALEENQRKFEFQTVDAKTILLHETVDEHDELCTSLELSHRSQGKWRPRTRNDGRSVFDNSTKTVSNVISCETPSDLPEIAGEWTYESESGPGFIECFLDVEHVPLTAENALGMKTTYDIIINPELTSPSLPPNFYQKHSEIEYLNSLVSDLEIRETKRFAREMGVSDTSTELVFSDNSGNGFECKYRVVLTCFRQLGPKVFAQKLPEVLTTIGRLDIVQKLNRYHFTAKEDRSISQAHTMKTKIETDV